MPAAHVQHLATIEGKLRARGSSLTEALEDLDSLPAHDPVARGLRQVVDALGLDACRSHVERGKASERTRNR